MRTVLPPTAESLQDYLDVKKYPLLHEQKVPITKLDKSRILRSSAKSFPPTMEDLDTLFRESDHEWSRISEASIAALKATDPDSDGTEDSFHSFWDLNIRYLLEAVFPAGVSVRNSNRNTRTLPSMPDYGFTQNRACSFRGEEKPTKFNGDHPRDELFTKLKWTYNPLPYILGLFHCIGRCLNILTVSLHRLSCSWASCYNRCYFLKWRA
jgi:hypothetical protein